MIKKRKATRDAVELMHRWFFEGRPDRQSELLEAYAEGDVQRLVYDLREQAGLTQEELAAKTFLTPRIIDDIEAADYDGDYLSKLYRIAAALDMKVEIRVVPNVKGKKKPAMAAKSKKPARTAHAKRGPARRTAAVA